MQSFNLNRPGLTLTAESECIVANASTTNRPSSTNLSSLSQLIQPLLDAIESERTYVEDEFQAQVCLGWIHWMLNEPGLTVARLPKDVDHEFAELDGTGKQSAGWTRVCAVKGAYLKGASHSKLGADSEALQAFDTGMPILSLEGSNLGYELRVWTELLLSNACLLYSKVLGSRRTRFFETETLSAFRSWAKFWEIQSGSDSVPGGSGIQSTIRRRYVWRQYYLTLSNLLQKGQPYPTSSFITAYVDDSAKARQSAELEKVQTIYESLLLREVEFPKAEEESEEVEQWVETVAENWSVLCGSNWLENELSKGREGTSRLVLDILYRAATKTFHSTRILRYLFIVHLAVADFDLAFKAFDTYLNIVKKGKSREEKTGETVHALDDDETVLMTAAECIRALCRYGSRDAAEKARGIGRYVEDWLNKHKQGDTGNPKINGDGHGNGDAEESFNIQNTTVSMHAISKTWLSVGISQAQWARFTYESAARSDIQLRAIECFRKALSAELQNTHDVEALFALGILLSERRELDVAIEVVKSALLPSNSPPDSTSRDLGPYMGEFAKERSLIPLWHLLALLLSARQEFTTAARSCEGAFEQFRDPTNLFGHSVAEGAYRSDHLNEKSNRALLGAVDTMEDIEKETILEVKITQLALVEVLEGPEVAVNASDELLSLYARLFGDPDKTLSSISSKTTNEPPPKSSAGTIRTLGGSLFGRSNKRHSKTTTISEKSEGAVDSARPQTNAAQTPAIQITNDAGSAARHHGPNPTRERSTHRQEKLQKSRNRSSSAGKSIQPRNSIGISSNEHSAPSTAYFTPPTVPEQREQNPMVGVAISSEDPQFESNTRSNTLPPTARNMQQTELPLRSNGDRHQDNRLPQPFIRCPATRFPKRQQRRRRLGTLVRLWLLVAGFYRRATMLEDANGALEEAKKLVEALEMDVSQDQSGEVSVQHSGWGGGKSVEELWGDVWAEVSTIYAGQKPTY